MKGTYGLDAAATFSCLLEGYGIQDKIIAYVTDSESNLSTCTSRLTSLVNCIYSHMDNPYHRNCLAHSMSNLCKKTLKSNHYKNVLCSTLITLKGKHTQRYYGLTNLERGIECELILLESQIAVCETLHSCRDLSWLCSDDDESNI